VSWLRAGITAAAVGLLLSGDGEADGRGRPLGPMASFSGLVGNDWPWDASEVKDVRRVSLAAFPGPLATLRKVRIVHRHHLAWYAQLENIHPTFTFDPRALGINPINGQPWGYDFPAWFYPTTESGTLLWFCELPAVGSTCPGTRLPTLKSRHRGARRHFEISSRPSGTSRCWPSSM